MHSQISTGWEVGTWIAGILGGIALVWLLLSILAAILGDDTDSAVFSAVCSLVMLLFVGGLYTLITWPTFDMQYHTYVPKGGVISDINSRGIADGHGTTWNYAVTFQNDPTNTYRCDDTRCAVLHKGDTLHLLCIRDYQWNAVPGWDCNFYSAERKG